MIKGIKFFLLTIYSQIDDSPLALKGSVFEGTERLEKQLKTILIFRKKYPKTITEPMWNLTNIDNSIGPVVI